MVSLKQEMGEMEKGETAKKKFIVFTDNFFTDKTSTISLDIEIKNTVTSNVENMNQKIFFNQSCGKGKKILAIYCGSL